MTDTSNPNAKSDIDLAHEELTVSDSFNFTPSEDADASGSAVDDDMAVILAGADPIDTLLVDLEDDRVVDDPAQIAGETSVTTHTYYSGYVAINEDG